jgi:hypothetical protein
MKMWVGAFGSHPGSYFPGNQRNKMTHPDAGFAQGWPGSAGPSICFRRRVLIEWQLSTVFICFPFSSFHHPNIRFLALRTPMILGALRFSPHGMQHPGQNKAAPERDLDFSRAFGNCLAFSNVMARWADDLHFSSLLVVKMVTPYKAFPAFWKIPCDMLNAPNARLEGQKSIM